MILPGPDYPAPAKLNLFLHVLGRRPDGYHLLQTAFVLLDYGDTLRLRVRADGRIVRIHPLAGVDAEHDLSVRAARLLQRETGCKLGADIELLKRLPMGGGLGGGSSDAATVLIVLNRLWGTGLQRERLQQLALTLGADVPVFVFGRSAFAEGVGEVLTPLTISPAYYLVLIPPLTVPTAEVFSAPELTRDTIPIKMSDFAEGAGHNDLQPVVCGRYPVVAEHLAWLKRFGDARFGDARMTGSGACVFAPFPSRQAAQAAAAELPPTMRGFVACSLSEHPLLDWVR